MSGRSLPEVRKSDTRDYLVGGDRAHIDNDAIYAFDGVIARPHDRHLGPIRRTLLLVGCWPHVWIPIVWSISLLAMEYLRSVG